MSYGKFVWRAILAAVIMARVLDQASAEEAPNIPEIGSIGPISRVHTDFQFTEGPAADSQGRLYFSDVAGNKIYRLDADRKLSIFLEPSSHANGLFFDHQGHLIVAQMDGRVVRVNIATKEVTPIVETFEGKRFNAPNDLAIDRDGGVYFTDPRFRAPDPWPQVKEAVYYVSPKGEIRRVISDVETPNGVLLSPDEKTLYVVPTLKKEILAYDVKSGGELGPSRVFASLNQPENGKGASPGGDGLTVDAHGNLYVTSALGLQVFNSEGKHLGTLKFPEQPSNATFGGPDLKTLFVTARKSLYAVDLGVAGHRTTAGQK